MPVEVPPTLGRRKASRTTFTRFATTSGKMGALHFSTITGHRRWRCATSHASFNPNQVLVVGIDQYHFSFSSLVVANSATTLITVPLVFLLPRLIVSRKDAEIDRTTTT